MLNALKADADLSMLLVIDLQTSLLPQISGARDVLMASGQLIRAASIFQLPIVVTEQYPRGIGHTHPFIQKVLDDQRVGVMEKAAFSACCDDAVKARINEIDRPHVVVCGIETHVCVQQTTLDLLAMGCRPFVCADAVGSRKHQDYEMALARMRQAGATITTVEAILFELCHLSGTDRFKELLPLIKDPAGGESPPEI